MGFKYLDWAEPLLSNKTVRYKVVYGGRASSKTAHIAIALLTIATYAPVRIAVVRQRANSMSQSVHALFKRLIEGSYVRGYWSPYRNDFKCVNGSHIFCQGLSDVTMESIKGLDFVKYVWVEEGQAITEPSWEMLDATIREPGAQIFCSMNPKRRHDPIYYNFIANENPLAWVFRINYTENTLLDPAMIEVAEMHKRLHPDRYAHVWLGEPDDGGGEKTVIPFRWLNACTDLYARRRETTGRPCIGLDPADTGVDKTAMVTRTGPALDAAEQWTSDTQETSDRAHAFAMRSQCHRLAYDAGGVGAGVRAGLNGKSDRRYYLHDVNFGGRIEMPDYHLAPMVRMSDVFPRVNSQMAFNLRRRAENSFLLSKGYSVALADCLLINPDVEGLNDLLTQLAQPQWKENASGHIVLDKTPDNAPSPDLFDAACLAFYGDLLDGSFRMPQGDA